MADYKSTLIVDTAAYWRHVTRSGHWRCLPLFVETGYRDWNGQILGSGGEGTYRIHCFILELSAHKTVHATGVAEKKLFWSASHLIS